MLDSSVFILHRINTAISVTRLVTIHYFEFAKDFVFDGEVHDIWELVYVDKGEIVETAGSETVIMRQGDILFHRPGEFHSLRANGRVASNVFVMTFVSRSRLMSFFAGHRSRLTPPHRRLIAAIIEEGRQAFDLPFFDVNMKGLKEKADAPVGAQQMIRLYLEQLLILLMREKTTDQARYRFLPSKDDVDDHVTAEIIRLMEKHLYGKLSIEKLCEQLNYGKTYLSLTFKSKTGYSIKHYYTILKIAEAKKLIREKNHTITEIAMLLQYESSQYFSRVFQRITNMTPTEYKASAMIC